MLEQWDSFSFNSVKEWFSLLDSRIQTHTVKCLTSCPRFSKPTCDWTTQLGGWLEARPSPFSWCQIVRFLPGLQDFRDFSTLLQNHNAWVSRKPCSLSSLEHHANSRLLFDGITGFQWILTGVVHSYQCWQRTNSSDHSNLLRFISNFIKGM